MGCGVKHARNLRKWIKAYLHSEKLPLHRYGTYHSSILDDEDFRRDIQLHLTEIAKKGYIRAQDIVDYVATPEVQQKLGTKAHGIHIRTARRWLHKLSWRYQQKKKGMYIDGHEREDVVEYRKGFVERWREYERRFVIYGNDGKILLTPTGFPVPQGVHFRLILVTHDESTFYENDRRKLQWVNDKAKPVAEKKGEGQSIMISEFLTLNGDVCKMEMSEKSFMHCQLWDSPLNLVRHVCSSKQGKTGMGISMGKTYFDKLRTRLTFSKQSQMVLRLAFFCSTMLPATRNEPQMLSPQGRCQKAHTRHGDTIKKGRK